MGLQQEQHLEVWPHEVHTTAVPLARVTCEGPVEVKQEDDAAVQCGRRREGRVERCSVRGLQLAVIRNCSLFSDGQIIVWDLRGDDITMGRDS